MNNTRIPASPWFRCRVDNIRRWETALAFWHYLAPVSPHRRNGPASAPSHPVMAAARVNAAKCSQDL
jgi:hypothetical protein